MTNTAAIRGMCIICAVGTIGCAREVPKPAWSADDLVLPTVQGDMLVPLSRFIIPANLQELAPAVVEKCKKGGKYPDVAPHRLAIVEAGVGFIRVANQAIATVEQSGGDGATDLGRERAYRGALADALSDIARDARDSEAAGCTPWMAGSAGDGHPSLLVAADGRLPLEAVGRIIGAAESVGFKEVFLLADQLPGPERRHLAQATPGSLVIRLHRPPDILAILRSDGVAYAAPVSELGVVLDAPSEIPPVAGMILPRQLPVDFAAGIHAHLTSAGAESVHWATDLRYGEVPFPTPPSRTTNRLALRSDSQVPVLRVGWFLLSPDSYVFVGVKSSGGRTGDSTADFEVLRKVAGDRPGDHRSVEDLYEGSVPSIVEALLPAMLREGASSESGALLACGDQVGPSVQILGRGMESDKAVSALCASLARVDECIPRDEATRDRANSTPTPAQAHTAWQFAAEVSASGVRWGLVLSTVGGNGTMAEGCLDDVADRLSAIRNPAAGSSLVWAQKNLTLTKE